MSTKKQAKSFVFLADKIYVHHWPLDTPKWSSEIQEKVNFDLHKNKDRKKIQIENKQIKINDYLFTQLQKIGITIPLFKKETTIVFEGCFEDYYAHIHITSKDKNYLEIFNNLMSWKIALFPED
ncbi:MAG: hypothetical protein GTN35_00465 [Nitrososphaeria archaeon]|nr:hypothetical protein [Nitrosopumilaceae archaeon]NIP10354.1 hypothetical protein [Nitrosopumilaceae archaeon]NIP90898.1 hypothetical protein [Nitrososphaeria archaeon]NIS95700.1 hypothetical protein [Nitrosopumilaceae archaeon]